MIYSQMHRCDEPPPTLGVVLTATLFSLLLVWPEIKLFTLVASWHLPWAATVILQLFLGFVGITLAIVTFMLLLGAATKLANVWNQHQGRRRDRAADNTTP